MTEESAETLRFRMRLPASPTRIFELWTQPESVKRWFGGFETEVESVGIDLRVGGAYQIIVLGEQGPSSVSGEFLVIEPPSRLRYTWRLEQAGQQTPTTIVTVAFHEADGATEVELEHGPFLDKGLRQLHSAGWNACFQALESLSR